MIGTAKEFVHLRTSERPEEYLRAATESAPLEVWLEVLQQYPDMKGWVAHNKTIPMRILECLALDPDPFVRAAVAAKNKLSEELMLNLARDSDLSVRERIAQNKNASVAVLRVLVQDSDVSISQAARHQLSLRGK